METQFSIIVIGNGLIGSAAARYLAGESDAVALLGPPEPSDWENHDGVFSSHYDEGRITRIMDSNPHWAEFAHRSIDEYPNIEKESGIREFPILFQYSDIHQSTDEQIQPNGDLNP